MPKTKGMSFTHTSLEGTLTDTLSLYEKKVEKLEIKIKYLDSTVQRLSKIDKGDWIDLYAAEDIELKKGEMAFIHLGVAMQLPKGYEVHLAPRSSTYKKWGIIQANHVGVIDESYCGDNDWWKMPVICLNPTEKVGLFKKRTIIRKGDKIAQFRVMKKMPTLEFEEVDILNNEDRGGFGSTGDRVYHKQGGPCVAM